MAVPSPTDAITDASLRITVKVDGAVIKDTYGISSISITHAVNKISVAEINLRAEVDIDSGALPLSDGDDFKPGKAVEITAGYGDSGETSIFKGLIVKHGVDIDEAAGYTFRITCKHKAVTMTFLEKEASFTDKTDSDIITSIIGTYSLSSTVDAASESHPFVFQHMATDWDFILARAEFNGYITLLDGDDIKVIKPLLSATSVLRLGVGDAIMSFSAELNAEDQPTAIEAHAWDAKTQALLTSTATEPTVNTQGTLNGKSMSTTLSQGSQKLISPTPMATDALKTWAEGLLLRKRLSALKGTIKFIGSSLVKPGSLVDLENVGSKFNGTAFVSSVVHSLDNSDGWNTTIKIGLENSMINRKTNFSFMPAGGQMPAIHGLQVGTVKKLSADPGSENRIQITLPSNAETSADVWARFANFYGTNGAGLGFLPEVGDEVVVGFFADDPRYPVILGSMYSSKIKSPNPPADEKNNIKSITSRSKIKITMDDDKKSIKIETPGGNMITFSDDAKSIEIVDQNSNSIKMTSSGINIESAKDITIKATGGITLNATKAVAISSSAGDVTMEGLNVSATAKMGFTAKGNATAEISASGQTTVKGGVVMIN